MEKKRNELETTATLSQSTEQQKTKRKAPIELSMKYIIEKCRADAREVEIRTRVERELRRSGNTPEPTPKPHLKLIKQLSTIQQQNLFSMLIDNSLLSTETNFDSFCFVFGSYLMPNDYKPLKWLANRQLLRELIVELKHPDAIIPTSKYNLPPYFIDKKDKKIIELPTNTPKDLKIHDILKNLAKI